MDYCTFWPEGWWAYCCKAHDDDYAAQVVQAVADGGLFRCVVSSAPTPALAVIAALVGGVMWTGVRLFGSRFHRKAGINNQTKDLRR